MAALGLLAYYAPSEQFLNWGGVLSVACTGMVFVSLASIYNPASMALYNVWLWGGLGLTGFFALYDTQAVLIQAKTLQNFDALGCCLGLYMNAINFFVRMMLIFGGQRKK